MKKLFTLFIAAIMAFTAMTAAPKRAEAALGILGLGTPAGIPLIIAGGAVSSVAIFVDWLGLSDCVFNGACADDPNFLPYFLTALGLTLGGVLLLDEESGQTLRFQAVTTAEANTLGLTSGEESAFNVEIDEVNAVSQSVGAELKAMKKPGVADSKALWEKYRAELSPEAYSAVGKVSANMLRALKGAHHE
jgi:hypothetical protein